jgi:hypothetical protein
MEIQGNAYAYNVEATLPGVAFRSVNEAYVESTGTFNQRTESLVDPRWRRRRGPVHRADPREPERPAGRADAMKVKAASYKFQDAFINGDVTVDAKGFDGLKKRLTGAQVIPPARTGWPVVGNGGTDTFDVLRPARRPRRRGGWHPGRVLLQRDDPWPDPVGRSARWWR